MMISDWNTRNYKTLIFSGLRRRWRRAQFGRECLFILSAMWDAAGAPLRIFLIGFTLSLLAALAIACPGIDPGICAPHADESPFEGANKSQLHVQPVAQWGVNLDSCTICGKDPETGR